ncbi:MAG TPA: hypothetical protein VK113_04000, partial [Gemmatimonadales bacterium]|nr:hypothetical protein [Gemmatimonadales bacterium]
FEATSVQETMIKRLTDEPTKLAEARPDLSFPAGLQAVLDTALACTPIKRYQTVSKFAADVAAITGQPSSAAVPHTRSRGDTEGKTQLIVPSGATQRISAASAPSKRRSLMPAAIGVVVILAGGGAWIALNSGGNGNRANPNRADTSRVPRDTAKQLPVSQTTGGATRRGGATVPGAPPVAPPAETRINPAQANRLLEDLIEKLDASTIAPATVRDSAQHIFNTRGIATTDSAFAAYILANAFAALDDREPRRGHKATALQWARQAANLQPTSRAYQQLVQDLARP